MCVLTAWVLLWKSTGSVRVPLELYQPLSRVSVHSRDANRGRDRDRTGLAIRGPGSAGGEAVSIGQAGKADVRAWKTTSDHGNSPPFWVSSRLALVLNSFKRSLYRVFLERYF